MSEMSQLAMELDEQAAELGFRDYIEAELHGWRLNYEKHKLEPPVVQPSLNEMEELKQAHEEWLKRKSKVLKELEKARESLEVIEPTNSYECEVLSDAMSAYSDAIKFIEEGER